MARIKSRAEAPPMTRSTGSKYSAVFWLGCMVICLLSGMSARALPTVTLNGTILTMSNVNVTLQYDLSKGKANFYWQGALKIYGFYAGYDLSTSYITGNVYSNHTYSVSNNTVIVTSTSTGLQTMKQYFIFDQNDSFLTRLEVDGAWLKSDWMGPVVVDTSGYVDIGSYNDDRALFVPFDNDSFVCYNAMPINTNGVSYEVAAFYDNTTRNGLVVGSVTHDTWKSGVYFVGTSSNKLVNMNVYGGVVSSQTRDVATKHGQVTGATAIFSPLMFVGFGTDWRTVIENFANENTNQAPRLQWSGGVPFGWNSWYGIGTSIKYSDAVTVSDFIQANIQSNNFNNNGVIYINLDSYWNNLNSGQLIQFVQNCQANGQKAGIYWTPFVCWYAATNITNTTVEGSGYKYSDIALRTTNGSLQSIDGGIAVDPTHPGTKQRMDYYINEFKQWGFQYLKLDFMTHGSLEGVHYDTNVTTGIQGYNQGMQYLLNDIGTNIFISESIAPIFPYQYGHSRRIACDTSTLIKETAYEMNSVTYGWWLSGRMYQYNDPDIMKFSGGTTNENQSRLIACAVSGTVYLNGDDLTQASAQALAIATLTNSAINGVAQAGQSFVPLEGNTGTNSSAVFVRQDGTTWCVAIFNYTSSATTTNINLARAGISGTYVPIDLWSGVEATISNSSFSVHLNAKQSKLFRLFTYPSLLNPQAGLNGTFGFTLQGDAGHTYAIQTSTDMRHWSTLTNILDATGQTAFTQTNAPNGAACFYRAQLVQ